MIGTEAPATRSTARCIGLCRASASRTARAICAQRVAAPAPVTRITSGPSRLMLPAATAAPADFARGRLSPVMSDSSARDSPASTSPSTGKRSPGRTRTSVPGARSRAATRVSVSPSTHMGPLPLGFEQGREVADRAGAAEGLEIAAEREQHQQHGRGVEIDVIAPGQQVRHGVAVGGGDGEGDQGGGAQLALARLPPGVAEERPAEQEQHGRRQQPQQQMHPGNRPASMPSKPPE